MLSGRLGGGADKLAGGRAEPFWGRYPRQEGWVGTGALGWRPLVWSGQDGRGQPGRWEGSAEEVAEWRPAPPFPSPPRLFRGGGVRPVALASSPSPSRGRCDLLGAVSARALCPSSPSAGLWGCWGPFTCPSISRGATRVSGWTRHGNLPRHHPPNTPTLRRGGGDHFQKERVTGVANTWEPPVCPPGKRRWGQDPFA